jgi:fructose-1,6-bisphosphatase class II
MRHINLDLVRVTEAAAIAASAWVGSGNKEAADKAATEAMRHRFNQMDFAGAIVIGEGKKDESFGLFEGEFVGKYTGRSESEIFDIAVDPIEGTRPTANSGPEALSVVAVGEKGGLFSTEDFYMDKLAYGPKIAAKIELNLKDPIEKTLQKVSAVTGKSIPQLMVCLLDRPRHESIVKSIRKLGSRIKLIQDCDVSGAIATCFPESGIDLLCGIGGAPEGVIAAAAIKCLRGGFQGQVMNKECKPVDTKIYFMNDLVKGNCAFAATGITNGSLLKGVHIVGNRPMTHSIFMRSESGTVRWLTSHHGN